MPYTSEFNQVTGTNYLGGMWTSEFGSETDPQIYALGFLTAYASYSADEDFAETFSTYVCNTPEEFLAKLDKAGTAGRAKIQQKLANDRIAFRYTGRETSGRDFSFYDAGMKPIVDAFARQDVWTTYKITYKEGNAMNPRGFIFTDEGNPDNSYYFEPNFRYYHYSIWE